MYYLIDDEKEIIFWISQKSGCTMFKNLVSKLSGKNIVGLNKLSFYKNSNNLNIDRSIKKKKIYNLIKKYKNILIIRNPYKRVISSYLQVHGIKQKNKFLLIKNSKNFYEFLLNFKKSLRKGDLYNTLFNNYTYIHTKPQVWISTFPTNFIYDINFYKIYDLENIDYAHLQTLYNKKYLLEDLINLKNTNHKHDYFEGINAKNITTKYIQDLKINKKKIPAYYNFFDEKTINLVKEIYRDDFDFFEKNNFNYSLNL